MNGRIGIVQGKIHELGGTAVRATQSETEREAVSGSECGQVWAAVFGGPCGAMSIFSDRQGSQVVLVLASRGVSWCCGQEGPSCAELPKPPGHEGTGSNIPPERRAQGHRAR